MKAVIKVDAKEVVEAKWFDVDKITPIPPRSIFQGTF